MGQAKRKSRLIGRIVDVRQWATAAGALTLTAGLLGAPWNSDGAPGDVRMVEAARAGDTVAVQALIRRRADVNASLPDGTTALHWAAQHGNLDLVEVLIGNGASVGVVNRYGVTPLRIACEQGHLAVVEALLDGGGDANARRGESGDTPVMVAARSGHRAVVKALLARGAEVDAVEPVRGQTALMWAAAERHAEVVTALLEAGADTAAVSKTGMSALMFAIRAGDLETTRLLLDRGADVNAPGAEGTSMLVLAILNARFDIAKLLLERGADPNVEDPHGAPLHVLAFLRRAQNDALSSYLPRQLPEGGFDSEALTLGLLARGADINARYANDSPPKHVAIGRFRVPFTGATPFFIAAITGDAPYMRFLAAHGADPSMGTRGNITPLLGASGIGALVGDTPASAEEAFEAVKAAYELGNDPTATVLPSDVRLDPSWANATALHGAATIGSNDMVQWLVNQGVPLDATSHRGANPYQVAAGLEGTIFNPWPETAAFILALAEERGITLETSEVPPPPMARTPQ